jgi:hypothetical protein
MMIIKEKPTRALLCRPRAGVRNATYRDQRAWRDERVYNRDAFPRSPRSGTHRSWFQLRFYWTSVTTLLPVFKFVDRVDNLF